MNADRITDALDLLTRAVETHDGAPADTNLARAQVLATIAVAEQLAKLTQAVAAQHGPPAPATGGQAETAPEQPREPRLMLGDVWSDGDGNKWTVIEEDGFLRLMFGGTPRSWDGANDDLGWLTLVQRAGYRRTTDTVTAGQLRRGTVVSCEEWEDDAPVTITGWCVIAADACRLEFEYRPLGGDRTTVVAVDPDMQVTLWTGQAVTA